MLNITFCTSQLFDLFAEYLSFSFSSNAKIDQQRFLIEPFHYIFPLSRCNFAITWTTCNGNFRIIETEQKEIVQLRRSASYESN